MYIIICIVSYNLQFGYSALSDYLKWRENIFFSAGHDTSLPQMLPCWFPKAVRRLIQLYVQVSFICFICH
jgi:hypothetical protein